MEGLFFFCISLRVLRLGVSSSISLALIIIDWKIVTRKFLGPADLIEAQTLCIHELEEVVIVGKHKNFILKIVSLGFESFNDG